MTDETMIKIEPLAVNKATAAAMLGGLSLATFESLTRTEPLLQPVQLSKHRVAWPVANLRQWLATRPASVILPPKSCHHGRAGKPKDTDHKPGTAP